MSPSYARFLCKGTERVAFFLQAPVKNLDLVQTQPVDYSAHHGEHEVQTVPKNDDNGGQENAETGVIQHAARQVVERDRQL